MKVYVRYGATAEEKASNFEEAMKRFKRNTNKDGIVQEVRKREFFIKPGVKKRLKREAAQRAKNKKKKY